MKKRKILIITIVLAIIGGVVFSFYYLPSKSTPLRKRMGIPGGFFEKFAKERRIIEITSEGFRGDFEKEITINKGGKIYFVNKDKKAHTLVREFGDQTASIELKPISTLFFPFDNSGEFNFYLKEFPEKEIKIIVK
ncbi:MAG: hypothetical protein DRH33_00035 [Candidatus Nealsonbacteria bacterium]|nr:MAG: hypothetical protein DRH33_00035 [Candidatus Nealsonbacteria bacterium]